MAVFTVAMMWLGYFFGTPRRHPDVSSLPLIRSPFLEGSMGISGLLAITAGGIFIALAVGSLLFGRRRDRGPWLASFPSVPSPAIPSVQIDVPTIAGGSGHLVHAEHHDLRGTLTLTLIFLGLFLVIYATHWVNLASLWRIG
jgi:cytochrome c oxidase subunit 1